MNRKENDCVIRFHGYDGEWLVPIALARKRGEAAPLVLCQIDHQAAHYGLWDNERGELLDEVPWYEPYAQRLELVDSFESGGIAYELRQVLDMDAYHQLWARVSLDRNIVFDVFSGNCSSQDIRHYIQHKTFTGRNDADGKGTWHYWTSYGGGSDEHYGSFYADDAMLLEEFQAQLAPERRAALFAGMNMTAFQVDHAETGELPVQFAKLRGEDLPLLLCRYHHALCYGAYSWDEGDFLKSPVWYEPYTQKLQLVNSFEHEDAAYQLFAITDIEAFKVLWRSWIGKRSILRDVALAILSANCDFEKIKQVTATKDFHFFVERLQGVADWEYIWLPQEMRFFHSMDENTLGQFEQFRYAQEDRQKRIQICLGR